MQIVQKSLKLLNNFCIESLGTKINILLRHMEQVDIIQYARKQNITSCNLQICCTQWQTGTTGVNQTAIENLENNIVQMSTYEINITINYNITTDIYIFET